MAPEATERTEEELDARGLNCPLPVLKAAKRLRALPAGAALRVLATDPAAPGDFEAFCQEQGHRLIETTESDGIHTIRLMKSG